MRNIVLARIDDRLIHGQIVTSWCKSTSANGILIADDSLSKDTFTQRLLKAAAPPDVTVVIHDVTGAAAFLSEEGAPGERWILLTKAPEAMERLLDAGIRMTKIILGGMGMKAGRTRFNKNVSASPEETACMKRLVERGIDMQYQLVPRELPVNIKKLLWED
ncbi:MAG: PTS sugar transporter subunit IIB [Eubacteriales bacterium]|nr:PTS sugar transporter subunit IIB [Eubacteriales bacterium]